MTSTQQTSSTATLIDGGFVRARGPSFSAIFAGVFIAIALYIALLILGVGLGFTVLSPWEFKEFAYSSQAIGMATVFWLIVTQIISSGAGGYVTGRLASTEWNVPGLKNQGVYFYHAVHGLVVWAIASVGIAFLLGTVASGIFSVGSSVITSLGSASTSIGKGAAAGIGAIYLGDNSSIRSLIEEVGRSESGMSNGSPGDGGYDVLSYAIDLLLRPQSEAGSGGNSGQRDRAIPNLSDQDRRMQTREITRIFINTIQSNHISEADKKYLAQLVANRTGLSQVEAEKRINDTLDQINSAFNKAEIQTKKALDSARHAGAVAALWVFASLFGGALVAGITASYGGGWRRRLGRSKEVSDEVI